MFLSSVVDRYQKKASNIIDDILTWKPKALSAFTGDSDGLNQTVIDAPEGVNTAESEIENLKGEIPETSSEGTPGEVEEEVPVVHAEGGSEGQENIRGAVPGDQFSSSADDHGHESDSEL